MPHINGPLQPMNDQVVKELHGPTKFLANLNKIQYYPNYLVFFQKEIEEKGSIFFSSFLRLPWISTANRAKLLEYKGRMDLCQYASRRSPTPLLEEIENYVLKREEASDWNAILERVKKVDDDGHACKLVRALAHGERICAPWEKSEKFRIKGEMWLTLGNLAIDSVEDTVERWVRSTGFDEAWAK